MIRLVVLILALSAAIQAADQTVDIHIPLWHFTGAENWMGWWTAPQPAPFHTDRRKDGTLVVIDPGKTPFSVPFLDGRYRNDLDIGDPRALDLDVTITSGAAATLALCLIDQDGMAGRMPDRALAPGVNHVSWDLTLSPVATWGKPHPGVFHAPLHLWEITISRPPATAPLSLLFTSASTVERRRPVDCATITLETGSPIHVLTVGHEKALDLRVGNIADQAQHIHVDSSWKDWDGRTQQAATDLDIPAHGTAVWAPPVRIDRRGAWKIETMLTDAQGQHHAERFWLAHLDPTVPHVGPTTGFLFGVCGGLTDPGQTVQFHDALLALAGCGARVVRGGIYWQQVESNPGVWNQDWFAWFPKELAQLHDAGIECQFLLAFTARWAAPAALRDSPRMTDWLFAPPDPAAWGAYVHEMISHFHHQIRFWEVWNETDIVNFWPGTNDQYLNILHIAHDEIRKVDPTARVMTSGFAILAGHPGHKDPDFAKKVVSRGRADFDILALHLHGRFRQYRSQLDNLMPPLLAACVPPAPIYFNETAVNVDEVGEHKQAVQMAKKLLYAWGKGAIGYTWYNLSSGRRVTIPGGDTNWGLMTEDWYPRPVYSAFTTLARRLATATSTGFIPCRADRIVVGFHDGGTRWLAAWDQDPTRSAGPQVVTVGMGTRVSAVDLMGDEVDLPLLDGKVLWTVGGTPGLLRIQGATRDPVLDRPIIVATDEPLAMCGRPCPVQVTVTNPRDVAQRIVLHWRLPQEWGGADLGEDDLDLKAGESRTVHRDLPVPAKGPRLDQTPELPIGFALTGTAWAGTAAIPLPVGLIVPAGGFDRPCDITLDDPSQVVNVNANVPQLAHLLWRGPADCSARCWLGRDQDVLRLKVEVRDDIQHEPYSRGDIWRGDSIQFALSVPGQPGWWEMGAALRDDGVVQALAWNQPKGQHDPMGKCPVTVHRAGDITTYTVAMPLAVFGLDAARLRAGIGFDIVVNDADTQDRKCWLQLASGIADRQDPSDFIHVSCQ